MRRKVVVRVYKREEFSLCRINSGVARIAQSAVLLVDDTDTPVAQCPFVAHGRAAVGRAVIHQNDFHSGTPLRHNAFYASVQRVFYLIYRYDDAQLPPSVCHIRLVPYFSILTITGPSSPFARSFSSFLGPEMTQVLRSASGSPAS